MTPVQLAALYASAFPMSPAWDAETFKGFLEDPAIYVISAETGFVLIRIAADEAEILTLGVDPKGRRLGVASALLEQAIARARSNGVVRIFLEVSAKNEAATKLYGKFNFREVARRPLYYTLKDGTKIDALVLSKALNEG